MSRHFFHLESNHTTRDENGVELDGLTAAKCHAVSMIAEVLCGEPQIFWDADLYRVTVTNSDGLVLFSVEMFSVMAPALTGVPR